MARVGPDELSGLRSAVIVDLREADERDTIGWVPGSVWRPVGADPEAWARALPAGRPLVLVCMTGRRSLALSDTVARVTGGPVVDLEGGTIGWAETGLPLVRMDAATLPGELAGDLRAVSMQEFQREVLSCFVATAIQVQHEELLEGDVQGDVYGTFAGTDSGPSGARAAVDQLAARAFAEGYPLDVIARNCSFYHLLAERIAA